MAHLRSAQQAHFLVEVYGLGDAAEGVADGYAEVFIDESFVFEFDFLFGGVDVDINAGGVYFEEEDVERVGIWRKHIFIGAHDGMMEVARFDKALIDEEELFAPRFAGHFRFTDEAAYPDDICIEVLQGYEFFVGLRAKEIDDALPQIPGRKLMDVLFVVDEAEADVGVSQHEALEFFDDVAHFHGVGFEEIAPGGDIEEEVFDGDAGTCGAGAVFLLFYFAAADEDAGAQFLMVLAGFHFHLSHSCYGGQGFAPKALGAYGKEVFGLAYFGSGVAFEGEAGICFGHAAAVVNDLDEAAACFFDDELDVIGAGIYGIFQEFFDDGGGPLDDFAGGNLVGDGFG